MLGSQEAGRFADYCCQIEAARLPFDTVLLRSVDSTNRIAGSVARELQSDEVAIAPTAFLAWEQTVGRGRQGRRWDSQPGQGIYASLLCEAPAEAQLALLPLVVPLALARVLDEISSEACRLDWPNDLVLGGKKVGGLLIEVRRSPPGPGAVIVGFGVNHSHDADSLPLASATSLALEPSRMGRVLPELGRLAAQLIAAAWTAIRDGKGADGSSDAGTARSIMKDYRTRSIHRPGDRMRCRVGSRQVAGEFLGFSSRGYLRLAVDGEEVEIGSGEIIEG